jgi:tRNA(Leu) C34 or U34 (ribose-2'-O)-methylase TrmL
MASSLVTLGLVNPKNPENVGSVMRAAGNYNVDHICYTGSRYTRALSYQPRTVDTHRKVSKDVTVMQVDSLLDTVAEQQKVVCIELVVGAITLPDYQHPEHAMYIFGPEDGSIDQAIIDKADDVVYVPTVGCMNLAATVNVVLYDRLAKQKNHQTDDELIIKSRDRNNRLRVSS